MTHHRPPHLPRLAAIAAALIVLVAGVRAAHACGVWTLDDHERSFRVKYLIETASVLKGKRRLAALYMVESPQGLRVMKNRKVVYDIRDGKVRHFGKTIGTIDGDQLRLGRTTYVITLANRHQRHDMPAWDVEVRRGDKLVASGEGMSLCAAMHHDPPLTEEQLRDEVARRVIYYLAWRSKR